MAKLTTLDKKIEFISEMLTDTHIGNYFNSKMVNASWSTPGTPAPLVHRSDSRLESTPKYAAPDPRSPAAAKVSVSQPSRA